MTRYAMRVFLVIGFAGAILGFQNCSKSNLTTESEALLGSSLEESLIHPLVQECIASPTQKLNSAISVDKIPLDLASIEFSPETRLLVMVDNLCIEKKSGGLLRQLAFSGQKMRRSLEKSAYQLLLDRVYSFQEMKQLAQDDECILAVDLNPQLQLFQVSEDPRAPGQKHLQAIEHASVYPNLFNINNGINSFVRVAVIDSGVDLLHPDLKETMIIDGAGKVIGYNAIEETSDFADSGFHGTHVAGLVAATSDNGIGGRGVLGKFIKIIPVKVSADGSSVDLAAVINGIRWSVDQGADVINMSLGGPIDRPAYRDVIQYAIDKGVFIVVASGNNGKNLGVQLNFFPAMYSKDYEGMITVGSLDATTKMASSFSNYSTTYVDLFAPGSDGVNGILSTVPSALTPSGMASKMVVNGVTSPIQGTSMAAPVASGAAAVVYALAKSRGYRPLPSQVEKIILNSAEVLSSLGLSVNGGKSLNLRKLVAALDGEMNLSVSSNMSRKMAKGKVGISVQPRAQQALINTTVNFEVVPTSDSATLLNYQWYKNGKLMLSETKPRLTIKNVNEASGAYYHVAIRAGSNEVISARAALSVGRKICPK